MMNLKSYLRGLGIGVVVTALIMGITAGRTKETLSNEEIKKRARALGMVEESQVLADVLPEEDGILSGEEDAPESESDAVSTLAGDALTAEGEQAAALAPEDGEAAPEGEDTADGQNPEDVQGAPKDSDEPSDTPEDSGDDSAEASGEDSAADSESEAENTEEADSPQGAENQGDAQATDGAENASGESVTILIESGDGSFKICQKLEDAGIVPLASEFDRYLYENGYDKRINIGTYEIPVGADFEQIAKIIAKLN